MGKFWRRWLANTAMASRSAGMPRGAALSELIKQEVEGHQREYQ
jgi:hypothetical protein